MRRRETENHKLSTAHTVWDRRWTTTAGRADWTEPEPEVRAVVDLLHARGGHVVLDLGCGVGRHALLFARSGFDTVAIDASHSGLVFGRDQVKDGQAPLWLRGGFTELPFTAGIFDLVLAWNVIYHGDRRIVRQALCEIARTLKPRGLLLLTMLSKRNALYGQGREVSRDTFMADTGDEEKRHPHYYCSARELTGLLADFEPLSLVDREQGQPGSWYWAVLAEKRATRP